MRNEIIAGLIGLLFLIVLCAIKMLFGFGVSISVGLVVISFFVGALWGAGRPDLKDTRP
ncbi:hypothetical protein UFOVP679_15 [uncultured Caudovirales phage]|uniref:Uncharacterized protein n=1 Tax=uncultured Caudovirales phage TaxID=2100421 RepID=A0A6J5NIQ3_9CAUD|nr:hypothetical protein UFOVP679_15 [uncultured Caudovirales phage]